MEMSSLAEQMAANKPIPKKQSLNIKRFREDKGLTLKEVSDVIGMTLGYYSQIELGKNTPSLENAYKIAKFWGMTIEEIWSLENAYKIAKFWEMAIEEIWFLPRTNDVRDSSQTVADRVRDVDGTATFKPPL